MMAFGGVCQSRDEIQGASGVGARGSARARPLPGLAGGRGPWWQRGQSWELGPGALQCSQRS